MPQTGQRPDDQQIQRQASAPDTVAAERDIHVVTKPAGERHVPAPPKVRHRQGGIGVVKVIRQFEAEQLPEPDGHITVAGEVIKDLHPIAQRSKPQPRRAAELTLPVERRGEHRRLIGDQHFLRKSAYKAPQAADSPVKCDGPFPEHRRGLAVAQDRPLQKLGEKAHIEQKTEETPLGPDLTALEVDAVSHELKAREADPGGQKQRRQRFHADQTGKEAQILEQDQAPQHKGEGQGVAEAKPLFRSKTAKPHERCHPNQQRQCLRRAPGVEKQGRYEQHGVSPARGGREKIQDDNHGQKGIQKAQRGKGHVTALLRAEASRRNNPRRR